MVAAVALQVGLFPHLSLAGVVPDLVLLVVVAVALVRGPGESAPPPDSSRASCSTPPRPPTTPSDAGRSRWSSSAGSRVGAPGRTPLRPRVRRRVVGACAFVAPRSSRCRAWCSATPGSRGRGAARGAGGGGLRRRGRPGAPASLTHLLRPVRGRVVAPCPPWWGLGEPVTSGRFSSSGAGARAVCTLLGRLWFLQVVGGESYQAQAADNAVRVVVSSRSAARRRRHGTRARGQPPVVGRDRRPLGPEPAAEADQRTVLTRLAGVLDTSYDGLLQRTKLCGRDGAPEPPVCWNGSRTSPCRSRRNVPDDVALSIQVRAGPRTSRPSRPRSATFRSYPGPDGRVNAAHVWLRQRRHRGRVRPGAEGPRHHAQRVLARRPLGPRALLRLDPARRARHHRQAGRLRRNGSSARARPPRPPPATRRQQHRLQGAVGRGVRALRSRSSRPAAPATRSPAATTRRRRARPSSWTPRPGA